MSGDQNEAFANFCAGADDAPEAFGREAMLHDLIQSHVAELYSSLHEAGYPVCGTIGAHTVGASIFDWVRQTGRGEIENCIALGQMGAAGAFESQPRIARMA